MRAIVTGIVSFVLFVLALFFIYPAVFGLISGLFENHDVGVAVGLVACAVITGPLIGIGIVLGTVATGFASALDDRAKYRRFNRR